MANGPLRSRALTSAFLFVSASGLMFGQGLEQGPPATGSTPYLTPAEELKLIELQDGYYLELVLSDPQIEEPVDIQFDGNGRMYVLEMRNYMNDADAKDQEAGTGVVSRHEDTNGDGVYDKHSIFASKLVLPRKIMVLDKGVVIGETHTHDLKYYEDTTGDGVADKIEMFHEGGSRGGNMEHQPNGFVWALDNWWYSTYNGFRYRLSTETNKLVQENMRGQSQWGIAQDLYGKVWYNDAGGEKGPMSYQHHLLYGTSGTGKTGSEYSLVWPIDNYPDTQGGHRRLRKDNTLNHFTATCGQSVFSGDGLPSDLVGDLIFSEPVGRLVRRTKVVEDEEGVVSLKNAYPNSEFIRSPDPNFHVVNSATAPDGTLYLVDMYRGIIQHGDWVTKGSYLRGIIDAYGLGKNVDRGRIWRLRHKDFKYNKTLPKMLEEAPAALVAHLNHPNGWWRMEAQKLIVLKADKSVVPALIKMAQSDSSHLGRIHALWTLEGLGSITPAIVTVAAADKHPRVREAACRLGEPYYSGTGELAALAITLAADPVGLVRKQAALSMRYAKHASAPQPAPAPGKGRYDKKEMALIKQGEAVYSTLCTTCHGADGKGFTTDDKLVMGPSLVGSPRVNGHPALSVSTVLYGLEGPIDGKTYAAQLMVPMGTNDDKWVAGVISYIRTSFGNIGAPITPEMVAKIRKSDARKKHWTQAEIEKAHDMVMTDRSKWILTASTNPGALKNAIDGKMSTRYDTKGVQKKGMWLNIELPETRRVSGIVLNNIPSANDGAKEFKVEASTDGKTWSVVIAKGKAGKPNNEILFPKAVQAKHLKITLGANHGGNYWSIHDLQLHGSKRQGEFGVFPKNPPSKQIVQMSLGSGMTRRRFVLTGSMVVASAKSLVGENGDQFTEEIQ